MYMPDGIMGYTFKLCYLYMYGVRGVWHESRVRECGVLVMRTGALE